MNQVSEEEIIKIHKLIQNGTQKEIQEIIIQHPNERYFYNREQESALSVAFNLNRSEIYELLLAKNLTLGPHENLYDSDDEQPKAKKRKIRDINIQCAKDFAIKHIKTLMSNCVLSHNTPEGKEASYRQIIAKSFTTLNAHAWIEPLLKIVSNGDKLKIVFDFQNYSVDFIDPTKNKGTQGANYYSEGDILIGAKALLEANPRKIKVVSVVAHEVGHYSMQLVFENDCKPFRKDDTVGRAKFDDVLRICELKKDQEHLIRNVFDYKEEERAAELIVRVPQLIALYQKTKTKLKKVMEAYSELFDFYEQFVLVELKIAYPLLKVKREVKVLNELCGVSTALEASEVELTENGLDSVDFESFVNISTNSIELTVTSIYQKLEKEKKLWKNIFIKLEALKNDKMILEAFESSNEVSLIVKCTNQNIEIMTEMLEKLKENDLKQRITFVSNQSLTLEGVFNIPVKHSWPQLTSETQQKLLQNFVTFQGKMLQIGDLLKEVDDSYKIPIENLLTKTPIKIGQDLKFNEIEFYVERKYLLPGANLVNQDPWTYDVELTIDDVLDLNDLNVTEQKRKMILMSEIPGMGKSKEFKRIADKLKDRYPSSWILLIELKNFTEFYQKDGEITTSFNNLHDVMSLLTQILKPDDFEVSVLESLFRDDRVVLLLDGFDEISPSYKQFMIKFMTAVVTLSNNQIWLSTREQFKNELSEIFSVKTYWIKRMTKEDRTEFFMRFLESKNTDQETFNRSLMEMENFSNSFEKHPREDDMFYNPLLFQMVTELMDGNLNMKLTTANYFVIFKKFVNELFKKCMRKGAEAEESLAYQRQNASIQDFYYKHALKTIFWKGHEYEVERLIKHTNIFNKTLRLSTEDIIRDGLMCDAGMLEPYFQFVHRSFAEFFIADFLTKKIFGDDEITDEILKLILGIFVTVCSDTDHKMIFKFIEDALENFEFEDLEKIKRVEKYFEHKSSHKFHLMYRGFIQHKSIALMQFCTKIFVNLKQNIFDVFSRNIFLMAYLWSPIDFLKKFWNFCTETFDDEQMKSMFIKFYAERKTWEKIRLKDSEKNEFMLEKTRLYLSEEKLRLMFLEYRKINKIYMMNDEF